MSKRTPTYRHHKASGQSVVTLVGKDFYLGKYGSPEFHAAFCQRAPFTRPHAIRSVRALSLQPLSRREHRGFVTGAEETDRSDES